jgi:hypothetical protein
MPGVFISYRREDTAGYSGRLFDHLSRHFGKAHIFIDIDAVPIGHDFVKVIDERIGACDVMIALIGQRWLTVTDSRGGRRLDDPTDFVRMEIETAFKRKLSVIPVLVGGARMPMPQDLPGQIVQLAHLNAFEIYDRMFDESVARLVAILDAPDAHLQRVARAFVHYAKQHLLVFLVSAIFLALSLSLLGLWLAPRDLGSQGTHTALTHARVPSTPAPETSKQEADIEFADRIPVRTPNRITALPEVVATTRSVYLRKDFRKATGPRHPRVFWRKAFHAELNEFFGVAGDGTLYFGNYSSLLAIRDGKELWAYNFGRGHNRISIAPDGRIWNQQTDYSTDRDDKERFFIYNSRGEGGLMVGKIEKRPEESNRYPDSEDRNTKSGETAKGIWFDYGECDLASVSGWLINPRGENRRWTVPLDGPCTSGVAAVNDDGELLLMTEAGTLYCITRQGRVRWTRKPGCPVNFLAPFDANYLVYGCGRSLHAQSAGTSSWALALDLGSDPAYSWRNFDKSGTLYLLAARLVIAIDSSGQILWKLPSDQLPLGMDQHGRFYLAAGSTISCFSD